MVSSFVTIYLVVLVLLGTLLLYFVYNAFEVQKPDVVELPDGQAFTNSTVCSFPEFTHSSAALTFIIPNGTALMSMSSVSITARVRLMVFIFCITSTSFFLARFPRKVVFSIPDNTNQKQPVSDERSVFQDERSKRKSTRGSGAKKLVIWQPLPPSASAAEHLR